MNVYVSTTTRLQPFDVHRVDLTEESDRNATEYVEELDTDFNVSNGDEVFVLWVTYRGMDEYNDDTDGEVLWVFKDFKVAAEAQGLWYRYGAGERYITFANDSGKYVQLFNPVVGYRKELINTKLKKFVVGV